MADPITPEQAALEWLAQVCADFANTLPISARKPFIDHANESVMLLRGSTARAE